MEEMEKPIHILASVDELERKPGGCRVVHHRLKGQAKPMLGQPQSVPDVVVNGNQLVRNVSQVSNPCRGGLQPSRGIRDTYMHTLHALMCD